jgi:hypothetical protein
MSWTAHHRDRSTWPAQVYGRHARGSPKVSFAEKLALYFSPTFYPWNLHLKRYCIAVNWVAGLGLPGILLDFFTTWPERDVSVARNQQNCSLEPKKNRLDTSGNCNQPAENAKHNLSFPKSETNICDIAGPAQISLSLPGGPKSSCQSSKDEHTAFQKLQ